MYLHEIWGGDHESCRLELCMAVWLQAKVCYYGLGLRFKLYASYVCDEAAVMALYM